MTSEIWITKDPWTIAQENWQNGWFTSFDDRFTLKMCRLLHAKIEKNGRFTSFGAPLTPKMGRFARLDQSTL
ncbi:hypothetical protein H5410_056462 [Solanum commersonii]|uniref:Uncharacterized protein n=1 Tax=Solanum commersonii TaxID=4109 RepID=A0A9J5WMR6_SOLCO|nr:hypothetical protein H5410_056462 [Solanum commersonii]